MAGKVPAPSTSSFAVVAPAADLHATFIAWQDQISPKDRARLAELVRSRDLTSITGMMAFHQDVIVSMFEGTLSPVVAMAAKPWVESMLVMIANREAPAAEKERDLTMILMSVKDKVRSVPASYTQRPRELEDNTIEAEPEEQPLVPVLLENEG